MRQIVIGTAGHVDHGKTALVQALTGVQTDRLPEEQRRGITIELGFAPWRIADDLVVSIVDAPGHRRLVHTMIAGATGIDIVLLAVAADEGVMPQTREHLAACELLGVTRAVVAITKVDRADEELAELAGEEALELVAEHGIEGAAVVCSAVTGQGVDDVRQAVMTAIEAVPARPTGEGHLRLAVDRVFTIHGSGTVVTGTLVAGQLANGTALRVLGGQRELAATARGLHVHGEACDQATAPTRLAINLALATGRGRGAGSDVSRGDILTNDPDVQPTRILDAWLQTQEKIKRGTEASCYVGTTRSVAKLQPIAELAAGQEQGGGRLPFATLVRLRLSTPLVFFGGDRFVLRGAQVDGPAGAVIGGGVVLDAHPPQRPRAGKRVDLLTAANQRDATDLVRALATETGMRPLLRQDLGARFPVAGEELVAAASALVDDGELVPAQRAGWLTSGGFAALAEQAVAMVTKHHAEAPLDAGLPLQTLRERLTAVASAEATAELVERVTATGAAQQLVIEDDVVRLPSFDGSPRDERTVQLVASATEMVRGLGLQGVGENAMSEATGADAKRVRALLAYLVRTHQVIRSGDLWFDAPSVEQLQEQVVAHLDGHGELTIKDFKAMTGLGRKQTIPLLEHFDREKVTKREGEVRVRG